MGDFVTQTKQLQPLALSEKEESFLQLLFFSLFFLFFGEDKGSISLLDGAQKLMHLT